MSMNNYAIRNGYSRMLNASAVLILAGATGLSSVAHAQSSLISAPWLFGASVGGVAPESLRDLSKGGYARAFIGIPLRPQVYIDASVFATQLPGQGDSQDEKTLGAGVDLHLESLGKRAKYVFLAGGGLSHTKRGVDSVNAPYINIGYGIEVNITDRLSLRPEVRGIARFGDDFIVNRGVTYDAALSLGLIHSFGGVPKASTNNNAFVPPIPPPPSGIDSASLPPADFYQVAQQPAPDVAPSSKIRAFAGGPCPKAPAGAAVDDKGCLTAQKLTLPRSAFFSSASTSLSSNADSVLEAIAATMFYNPALVAVVVVHTDSLGFAQDNLTLTENMAGEIRNELLALGMSEDRVQGVGMGESHPSANEDTDAGVEKNRRIEIDLRPR